MNVGVIVRNGSKHHEVLLELVLVPARDRSCKESLNNTCGCILVRTAQIGQPCVILSAPPQSALTPASEAADPDSAGPR